MYQEIALISKKNKVQRVINGDFSYIEKTFRNEKSYNKELEVLKFLNDKDIAVPKILGANKDSISLEDLGEITLLSIYEDLEKNDDKNYQYIIDGLLFFLESFYNISEDYYEAETILSDMNFRNFIIVDRKTYRIDFEEVNFGNKESDIGKLLAFGSTYNPKQTEWKKEFEKTFVIEIAKTGLYDMEIVMEEKELELKRIKKRRK
jgi:RIO-like serine/threonine protein kinase